MSFIPTASPIHARSAVVLAILALCFLSPMPGAAQEGLEKQILIESRFLEVDTSTLEIDAFGQSFVEQPSVDGPFIDVPTIAEPAEVAVPTSPMIEPLEVRILEVDTTPLDFLDSVIVVPEETAPFPEDATTPIIEVPVVVEPEPEQPVTVVPEETAPPPEDIVTPDIVGPSFGTPTRGRRGTTPPLEPVGPVAVAPVETTPVPEDQTPPSIDVPVDVEIIELELQSTEPVEVLPTPPVIVSTPDTAPVAPTTDDSDANTDHPETGTVDEPVADTPAEVPVDEEPTAEVTPTTTPETAQETPPEPEPAPTPEPEPAPADTPADTPTDEPDPTPVSEPQSVSEPAAHPRPTHPTPPAVEEKPKLSDEEIRRRRIEARRARERAEWRAGQGMGRDVVPIGGQLPRDRTDQRELTGQIDHLGRKADSTTRERGRTLPPVTTGPELIGDIAPITGSTVMTSPTPCPTGEKIDIHLVDKGVYNSILYPGSTPYADLADIVRILKARVGAHYDPTGRCGKCMRNINIWGHGATGGGYIAFGPTDGVVGNRRGATNLSPATVTGLQGVKALMCDDGHVYLNMCEAGKGKGGDNAMQRVADLVGVPVSAPESSIRGCRVFGGAMTSYKTKNPPPPPLPPPSTTGGASSGIAPVTGSSRTR
jgi:hypothetical protein